MAPSPGTASGSDKSLSSSYWLGAQDFLGLVADKDLGGSMSLRKSFTGGTQHAPTGQMRQQGQSAQGPADRKETHMSQGLGPARWEDRPRAGTAPHPRHTDTCEESQAARLQWEDCALLLTASATLASEPASCSLSLLGRPGAVDPRASCGLSVQHRKAAHTRDLAGPGLQVLWATSLHLHSACATRAGQAKGP